MAKKKLIHVHGEGDCARLYAKKMILANSGGKQYYYLDEKSSNEDIFKALSVRTFLPYSNWVFWANADKKQIEQLKQMKPIRNVVIHTSGKLQLKLKHFDVDSTAMTTPFDFFGKANVSYQEKTFIACRERAEQMGLDIDLNYFLNNLGWKYCRAIAELEKFAYIGTKNITPEVIDRICPDEGQTSLAIVYDLACGGQRENAIRKYHILTRQRDFSVEDTLAYFYSMVRLGYILRVFMLNNPQQDASGAAHFLQELGWSKKYHPYYLSNIMRAVSRRSPEHIAEMLKYLASKFGAKDASAMEYFLAKW